MNVISFLFLADMVLTAVLFVGFKISCYFKKSCTWKSCPFRRTPYDGHKFWYCKKCPYPLDEEEKKEHEEEISKLVSLITDLHRD